MPPMAFDSGGVIRVTRKKSDTHRSSKGPKLHPIEENGKSKFKLIKRLAEEYKQQLADEEIKEYKGKK